jgi:hypothetical protein
MKRLRAYESDVWYEVTTTTNNNVPAFLRRKTKKQFEQIFREMVKYFGTDLGDFVIECDRITFYTKSADGKRLPETVGAITQTFTAKTEAQFKRRRRFWDVLTKGSQTTNPDESASAPEKPDDSRRTHKLIIK